MVFGITTPKDNDINRSSNGYTLTFIVPAKMCNLKCHSCYIKAKNESPPASVNINPDQYIEVIEFFNRNSIIDFISIQGFEPLLEESWKYTSEIIKLANKLGIRFGMVTNGFTLSEMSKLLSHFNIDRLAVSLDGSCSDTHNKSRGMDCFDKIINGINELKKYPSLFDNTRINSILYPEKLDELIYMPEFIKNLGLSQWAVTPLVNIRKKQLGNIAGNIKEVGDSLLTLNSISKKHGIDFIVENDTFQLDDFLSNPFYSFIRPVNPNRVIRFSANGMYAIGKNIPSNDFDGRWIDNDSQLLTLPMFLTQQDTSKAENHVFKF